MARPEERSSNRSRSTEPAGANPVPTVAGAAGRAGTAADIVGLGLTLGVILLSGVLERRWFMVPAAYWTAVLSWRLVAGGRQGARDEPRR